jgi:hypothetical protein
MTVFDIKCEQLDTIARVAEKIEQKLEPEIVVGDYYSWEMKQVGKQKTFNRIVTFAGSTMSVELPFSGPINLKKIEMWYDSSNAKTHNVRMHSNINPDAYAELDTVSATTAVSHIIDMGEGYLYLTANKLVFNFSSYTAADKVNIQVQLEDLI